MLAGTYETKEPQAPDQEFNTGRIKFGTESSGGFKNITITNCIFEHCRGLALETVDGGNMEDIEISHITMRDIVNAPIFLRLGARLRSPEGTPVGSMKRISINNITCYNADSRVSCLLSGIPGHRMEDIVLSDIRIVFKGGGTPEMAALNPPENERLYPEPSMFGLIPASGFFIRHAAGITLRDIELNYMAPDSRPVFYLQDVQGITIIRVKSSLEPTVRRLVQQEVSGLSDQP
jgi:polygalacturonase